MSGKLRLSGSTSGYIELQPEAAAASTTLTIPNGGFGIHSSYAVLMDVKSHGTQGQNLDTDDWYTRDLNDEYFDPDGITSAPSSNQFTLVAGTFFCRWNSLFHRSKSVKTRLYNVTDSSVIKASMNAFPQGTSNTSWTAANSHGMARFTIGSSKVLRLEYFADTDYSNVGGGYLGPTDADNTEEEIYTQLEIWKEA